MVVDDDGPMLRQRVTSSTQSDLLRILLGDSCFGFLRRAACRSRRCDSEECSMLAAAGTSSAAEFSSMRCYGREFCAMKLRRSSRTSQGC